jgi:hypothetical protein
MSLTDAFGNRITCDSAPAVAALDRAVDAHLHAWPGAFEALDDALALAPGFALAHAARALLLATWGRRAAAQEALARARASAASLLPREQSQVALIELLIGGQVPAAQEHVVVHARQWPTDALACATAMGAYGSFAFSGRLDHDAARLAFIESLRPHYPRDWPWLLANLGWAHIEAGHAAEGLAMAQQALAARSTNAHNAHIVLHGWFERGRPDEGLEFLDAWLPDYPQHGLLWGHLQWHGAMAELQQDRDTAASARLLGPILEYLPHGTPFMMLADLASLLWRLGLRGQRGLPWDAAHDLVREHFGHGSNVFGELHLAMLAAAAHDDAALAASAQRVQAIAERGHAAAPTALSWVNALRALLRDDSDAALEALARCCAQLPRVGGSHAQRTAIEATMAARRLPSVA